MLRPQITFTVLTAALAAADRRPDRKRRAGSGHAGGIFLRVISLSDTFEELHRIVELLIRARYIPDIQLLLKLYVVGWSTVSDVTANLLNDALDLGLAEQDISLDSILRNRHVRPTPISKLIAAHATALQHQHYKRLRNDLIHRGEFKDPDLSRLKTIWFERVMAKFTELSAQVSGEPPSDLSDQAVAAANADPATLRDITGFVEAKAKELTGHLAATGAFLRELDTCLADLVSDL